MLPRSSIVFLLVFLPATARAAVAPPVPRLQPLSAEIRSRLDRAALAQKLETPAQERINQVGNVPDWLLGRVALPIKEEATRAQAQDRALRLLYSGKAAPEPIQRLLDRLAKQLPPHLRPPAERWTLTVLAEPGYRARAGGAGYLYLSRRYLDDLLADRKRGHAALAFVLAEQMAHTALGHCRRGWQRAELEERLARGLEERVESDRLRQALQTGVRMSGQMAEFLYTRDQQYLADLLALQILRNAGISLDPALDALRHLAVLRYPGVLAGKAPGGAYPGVLDYLFQSQPDPLWRLKRLLQERDGLVDDRAFGLFQQDRDEGLVRCLDNSIAARQRPVVFVHGMFGNTESFAAFRRFFSEQKELKGRPLLVFRWQSNGSLARAGQSLTREIARVVDDPSGAVFVCHSAGGLVFRYYAEINRGKFERAVMLGTPHAGSNLTDLKALADLAELAGGLGAGLGPALSHLADEGRGEIGLDLHPDSLFLRHLGHDKVLAGRYHIVTSVYLPPLRRVALQFAFAAARRLLRGRLERVERPWLRDRALAAVAGLRLPEEVVAGDLIVSARSARLAGASQVTEVHLHHLALRTDPELIRQVFNWVLASPR